MKKMYIAALTTLLLVTGCAASNSAPNPSSAGSLGDLKLDAKHKPLPDYVLSSPPIVQETYKMAAQDQAALAAVPCYCGCYESNGHTSNLDCFVKQRGPNKEVLEWDPMGVG